MKNILFISALIALIGVSCQKDVTEGTDIYPKAEPPLVEFMPDKPVPNIASAGELVKVAIEGLQGKNFTAYVSSVAAEVVETTSSHVTVRVPADAITGSVSVNVDGQLYFGPTLPIRGSVSIDPNFDVNAYTATQGPINGIIQRDATSYILYGGFQGYAGQGQSEATPVRGVVIINANGAYASTTANDRFSTQIPRFTNITHMVRLASGSYLVAGGFSTYSQKPVNGIARVNSIGILDTMKVEVVNPDPVNNPNDNEEIVSTLNGGVSGAPVRVFVTTDDKYIVAGNFEYHVSTYYPMSQKGSPYLDRAEAPSIVKMFNTGSFDSSYNYDFIAKKGGGANGFVNDAVKLPNDDVIMVGNFTAFQNQPAGRIVRVKATDGKINTSFNAGSGADGEIRRITFNPEVPDRFVISGTFRNYNGVLVNGVAVIDGAGNLITTFKANEFVGGLVNYAGLLKNGNVVVSGSFTHYGTKVRPGLAILSNTGMLIERYNKFGLFRGQIRDMAETTSNGLPALFLVGDFNRYDNLAVGNIVKLIFTN